MDGADLWAKVTENQWQISFRPFSGIINFTSINNLCLRILIKILAYLD